MQALAAEAAAVVAEVAAEVAAEAEAVVEAVVVAAVVAAEAAVASALGSNPKGRRSRHPRQHQREWPPLHCTYGDSGGRWLPQPLLPLYRKLWRQWRHSSA